MRGSSVSPGVLHCLVGELNSTSMEFVLTDDLGSVRAAITNQAGTATVVGYMGYGPFGFVQYHAGQTGTNKGYTGQYNDPLSGLDYYVARYYDPVVGLFLSADTVQSNLQGFDPYAYVGNNPETVTDPTGHCDFWCSVVTDAVNGIDAGVPPVGLSADSWVLATEVNNGWHATPDQIAAAKLTGTVWGFTAIPGFIAGLAGTFCGLACLGVFSAASLAQLAVGLFVIPFANDINNLGTNFYAQHPIEPPIYQERLTRPPETPQPTPTPPINVQTNRNNPSPIPYQPNPKPIGSPHPRPPTTGTSNSHPPTTGSSPVSNWTYYTVVAGDTLWGIAAMFYGSGLQWQRIYQANIGVIGSNPNLIYVGERLRIQR
jgi:RHS repeat-associated protein